MALFSCENTKSEDNNTKNTDNENQFTDSRDNHVYKTVKIGEQIWMAENLAYKIEDGSWAYENDENNVEKYGRLYNWETAQIACPNGWHLPSDEEWKILEKNLGMNEDEISGLINGAEKLKDKTGFNTQYAGFLYKSEKNLFFDKDLVAKWWTSTIDYNSLGEKIACFRSIDIEKDILYRAHENYSFGFSVRCVKN